MTVRPVVLVILDGWGIAAPGIGNAITLARLATYPRLWKTYPHAILKASGSAVGLPAGQNGNSEAGHMNIGAGRVVQQDAVRINHAIRDGRFYKNPAFLQALRHVEQHKSTLHLMGLLTANQSGHAFPKHLEALLLLARQHRVPTFLHLFTDGRDTPKYEAINLLHALKPHLDARRNVATILGRLWMDRAKRWSRTEAAYNAIVLGIGRGADTAKQAVLSGYKRGESDEFVQPTIIGTTRKRRHEGRVRDHDTVIFFNLRSDRARQLAKPFLQPAFEAMNPGSFRRKKVLRDLFFVALTEFGPDLPGIVTAFPGTTIPHTLPMELSDMRQLYLAESEKYAHITYFFNGGYPAPVDKEDRKLIISSSVLSFDAHPAMESAKITAAMEHALMRRKYDFIAANYANADMVGHTGNLAAAMKAIQAIDRCLARLEKAVLQQNGYLLITGDHGNVEEMLNRKTGEINTEHSSNPVPLLLISKKPRSVLRSRGKLADIAPTILRLFEKQPPTAMKGHSLL